MSYFWESYTDSGEIEGEASSLTVENYFLYTRDIQLSRGGTAGINAEPERRLALLHPDYYRLGRDTRDDWQQVAVFSKPGETDILIQIWVQAYQGGLDDELALLQNKGKRLLIPLNSGPGYLATRADNEFIMATPTHAVSTGGGVGLNWMAVRADMHDLHGFVTNDLVQPSVNPKEPWLLTTHGYTGSRVYTETGAYNQTLFMELVFTTAQDGVSRQHGAEFPTTKGHLQSGDGDGAPYDQRLGCKCGVIYTGGEVVVHGYTKRLKADPEPDFIELGVKVQTTTVMSERAATKIDTVDDGTYIWNLWRVADVLDEAVGTNLHTFGGGDTLIASGSFGYSFGPWVLEEEGPIFGVYYDPWLSGAIPPPYTITSENGHSVFGGYLP